MLEIIDFYLNQLLNSKPSPNLKTSLEKLINLLKYYNYPNVELVDIISIRIMLDYILSDKSLIKMHETFIKKCVFVISDILSDKLYIKIEPKIISLESEFRKNICINTKQTDDKLSEEIKNLLIC